MALVNLTPHTITIVNPKTGEVFVEIPPSGDVCRVACTTVYTGYSIGGIPITRNTYGEVVNLPDEKVGTYYIVSSLVRSALIESGKNRTDIFIPNESIRDNQGRIIGCASLAQ